jgi:hypothetical protein
MRWVRHAAHERDEECIEILVGKPEGKRQLEDLCEDGMIILKWTLEG